MFIERLCIVFVFRCCLKRNLTSTNWLSDLLQSHEHACAYARRHLCTVCLSGYGHPCIKTAATAACTFNWFCFCHLFINRPVGHARCISAQHKMVSNYTWHWGSCWMHNTQLAAKNEWVVNVITSVTLTLLFPLLHECVGQMWMWQCSSRSSQSATISLGLSTL